MIWYSIYCTSSEILLLIGLLLTYWKPEKGQVFKSVRDTIYTFGKSKDSIKIVRNGFLLQKPPGFKSQDPITVYKLPMLPFASKFLSFVKVQTGNLLTICDARW